MKKLITAICTLALAATLLGSSTFAWFSMNRSVEAQGLKVTAKSDSSLVIEKDAIPTSATGTIVADFEMETAQNLFDSTHDLTETVSGTLDYGAGLKICSNPADIDPDTGKAVSGKTISYVNAVNNQDSNGKYYYLDEFVGIAAAGAAMTDKDISITLWNASATAGSEGAALTDINGAISVDFYLVKTTEAAGSTVDGNMVTVSSANYVGTLNLAHHKTGDSTAKTASTDALVVRDGSNAFTIPKAGTDESGAVTGIAIMMRIYVDGALEYLTGSAKAGKTYVSSVNAVSIAAKSIMVKFEAVTHTAA